jgi:cytochrome b subunit of formate dehydrogenase
MSTKTNIRIRRFTPIQRLFHVLLIISFMIQGCTGVARMYIVSPWGKWLASVFGGYANATQIHKYMGLFMICLFLAHILYLFSKIDWRNFPRCLFGPDSMLPQPQDIFESTHHVFWFFGLIKAPRFDRWTYWEKFDYWGVFWGIIVLGLTGLMLTFPLLATRILPGWTLNVALWVHRIEAILAMGHVFIIHFFVGHLRSHNFPMDRTMFEGSADLDATIHEKPFWIARMAHEGKLESLLVPQASLLKRTVFYAFGYSAIAVGLFLLVGGIINSPSITW